MFRHPFRARARHAVPGDDGRVVRSIDAPASLPLPFPPIPEMDELGADAVDRADRLTASGGADEFCGHAFDEFYRLWHAESAVSLSVLAEEQRRVDRALVDEMAQRERGLAGRAAMAAEQAAQQAVFVEQLWSQHFPAAAQFPVAGAQSPRIEQPD